MFFIKRNSYVFSLFIFLLIVLLINLCLYLFNPQIRMSRQIQEGSQKLNRLLKETEERYANDIYGGSTPEETYNLFLEALKKEDIDLASKYFIFEKQEEYKNLFTQIKNHKQWDNMMKDLLNPKNLEGELNENGEYSIKILTQNNELIAYVIIKKPTFDLGSENKEISHLWKIIQF